MPYWYEDLQVASVLSGSPVYAGGSFTSAGDLPRNNPVAFDGIGAAIGGSVNPVTQTGSRLGLGGSFPSVGGRAHRNFARAP